MRVTHAPDAKGRDIHRIRFRAEDPVRLDVTVTHAPGTPVASVDAAAPTAARYEVPFAERDLVSMIVGEMHRHEPNPVLRDAARMAAEISLPDDGGTR